MERINRRRRHEAPDQQMHIRLVERDLWILEGIAKMRFVTTGQIAKLYFPSRWAARKRLRRLFDVGLLRVWVRNLSDENIYSLTRAGAIALEEHRATFHE